MGERIIDERESKREESINIVDYVMLGEDGEPESSGMGRTINVGDRGLLLETSTPLEEQRILLVTLGLENDMIEFKGRITYIGTSEENKFRSGIEFMKIDEKGKRVLHKFLKTLVYKNIDFNKEED